MNLELEQGTFIIVHNNGTSNFATKLTMILSSFGIALSTCALLLLIWTAFLLQEWRRKLKNKLLIQFMLCRFYYTMVRFYFDIRTVAKACSRRDCIIYLDQVTMVYSELALISWMFIFSRHMYNSLVKVFEVNKPNIWLISVATWITPLVVSVLVFLKFRYQTGSDLEIFLIYLATIKWPVLITNAVTLVLVLLSITKKNNSKVNDNKSNARLVIIMNILIWTFCFQQLFMDVTKLLYIFRYVPSQILVSVNIMTTYQCAFTITFWVLMNANTRKMWKERCSRTKKQTPVSVQSSNEPLA